ncbi:MAG: hypothetical protein AAGC68_17930, partial [Verrucomicrobiota bacterium]
MKPDEHERDELLDALLHGDAGDETLRALAKRADRDPALANRIAEELAFSELIRQVLLEDEERGESQFREAQVAAELEMDEIKTLLCEGLLTEAACNRLARHLWDHPEEIVPLMNRLASDEWIREAVNEAKSEEAFVEALKTRMWAESRKDHFVDDFAQRLEREAEPVTDEKIIFFPGFWKETGIKVAAAAAIAAASFFLAIEFSQLRISESVVATVTKATGNVR